jgi:hypothetical protein
MISKLMPNFLKKKLVNYMANIVKIQENTMPTNELGMRHLQNVQVVDNRQTFLNKLPKNAIVAELGVDKGDFSEFILDITQPKKLHLIDAWDTERYHDGLAVNVQNKFKNKLDDKTIEIHRGYSTDWLVKFDDNYFDWVYIDTNHSYETTAAELAICQYKVKPGGIIAGHDYALGLPGYTFRYGVVEAVNEFCVKNNWEIIYLTHESHRMISYALRKIQA